MKKLITVILAFALCALMGTTAFAASGNETATNVGSKDIDVFAKYTDGTSTPDNYSVDASWGKMEFTYSASGIYQWDPKTHTYTDNTTAGWTETGNTVTVTNHSNLLVTAGFAFEKATGITDSIEGGICLHKSRYFRCGFT